MKKAAAFILGIFQFRSNITAHFDDLAQSEAYDHGRELAHRLTMRHFEQ